MAVNDNVLVVPGHGTFYLAPENTKVTDITRFADITSPTPPTGWENVGHTSLDDTVGLKVDGGDATVLGTWLRDATTTIYAATTWSLSGDSVQWDATTVKTIYQGWDSGDGAVVIPSVKTAAKKAMVVVFTGNAGTMAFYIPSVSLSYSDAPSFDTKKYAEIPFTATFQAAGPDVLTPGPGGVSGLFAVYGPEAFASAAGTSAAGGTD